MTTENEESPATVDNELRAFVTSTLTAVMNGVADAQAAARVTSVLETGEYAFSAPKEVAFDIAVNAKRTNSRKGGFKVEVFSVGANASVDAGAEKSTVSRIQFTTPSKYKKNADDQPNDLANGKVKSRVRHDKKTEASETEKAEEE